MKSDLENLKFPAEWKDMNVVLCHDWLTGMRGGERVLEVLCRAFPNAPIMTLIHNKSAVSEIINSHPIHTSWLQRIPGIMKYYRNLLPLFPLAIKSLHPPKADLIISTSSCVAKSIIPQPNTPHLCYIFTPMRYAWTFFDEYFGKKSIKGIIAKPILKALRKWDKQTTNRVTRFVGISNHVRDRINNFYERKADVVYPPVDMTRCTIDPATDDTGKFDLIVSALVPYKKIDLAVEVYNKLGFPLKIVGIGSELSKLREKSNINIEWMEWQSDETVLTLYQSCRMLIFPGEEDFGIVPLEAQACGKPVVAYKKGGALETVSADISGVFFDEQNEKSLTDGINRCIAHKWDKNLIRANADKFSTQNFVDTLNESIKRTVKNT
jgi:glycosyltransferase involved in cell wall biosynthesis